jgi:hypothetical protein
LTTPPTSPESLPATPLAPASQAVPPSSPLLAYIHAKFREVLGEPYSTLALDSQWSLRSEPRAPAIFVLVNGSYEKPAVWVFDPYATDNVWRTSITTEEQVDHALAIIRRRVISAAAAWKAR